MTNEPEREIQIGPPPVLEPPRSSSFLKVIGVLIVLLIIAGAGTYAWLNYGRLMGASPTADSGVPASDQFEETVTLKDFQAFQQQTVDSLQSATQDITAQQAELKQLSDQIAALTTKIDALQAPGTAASSRPMAPARPAPAAAAPRPAAALPGRPAPAVVAGKKPSAPKSSGPISVGGAPLPPAPAQDDQ